MFVFVYLVIISFTYLLVHSDGETTCDCSEIGLLKEMMQEILLENKKESTRLKRLEARQRTASYSKTTPTSKDHLEKLQQKVEDLEIKFNDKITTLKEEHEGFGRDIGAIVKKTLKSEKKEGTEFVSSVSKTVNKHKETIKTFKSAVNRTIAKRLEYITAMQNNHSQDIKETFISVLNNISKFQEDMTVEVNGRFDRIEQVNKESLKTFQVAMNNTIDERLDYITAIQNERSHEIKEAMNVLENLTADAFSNILNNISKFQGDIIVDMNRRLDIIEHVNKRIQDVAIDFNNINQSANGKVLDKIVKQYIDWLPWSEWGECFAPCNAGLRERSRACESHFGCIGKSNDIGICNTQNCGVRLVNGSNPSEGRLEIFNYGVWGTVCDDAFDKNSAHVVCKMLRFQSHTPVVYQNAKFGRGTLPIMLDDVKCNGSESSILSCSHRAWGSHNCGHHQGVGISCVPIRLVNGSDLNEGRLEVFHNGVWGTVCEDRITENAAHVVCNMLNVQSHTPVVYQNAKFGRGTLPIMLDDVKCNGSEISILSCSHRAWGSHNCGHHQDVGISCVPIRLVNGSDLNEGRLEVFHNGVWGTVCEDGINENAAHVVCNMLNFQSATPVLYRNENFGQGTLSIMLDDVKCTGSESSILSCLHRPWGTHNCGHHQDVGISCVPIRLVNGSDLNEGRLEVFHNGVWGTVCEDWFTDNAAHVVCNMLNFQSGIRVFHRNENFGQGTDPILLDDVKCNGSESSLFSCSHSPWGTHNCDHNQDIGISCVTVRLVNGSDFNEGRLEVFHKGLWGTVCEDGFTENSAHVVCKMLNFQSGTPVFYRNENYGQGTWPIMLDDVKCTGSESSIFSCSRRPLGTHNCGHHEDVGISCLPVRLVNGSDLNEGRLEVFHNGLWGTVCEDGFTVNSANVVCKMLNYPSGVATVFSNTHFGQGSLPVILDDVVCHGSESSIFSCSHRPWGTHNCGQHRDVGISCVTIRLVSGRYFYEGRLEVFHNGVWGTVCDDSFNEMSASVACKMLNLPNETPVVAHFEQGSLPILLDEVACVGSESNIFSCSHNPLGNHDCGHDEDVGIRCSPSVRLVSGRNVYEGRLEEFHNGEWETVCDDNFSEMSARAACNILNLPRKISL